MKQIKKNTQEMIHLTKQRDDLLPLLMNGQVSVNSDLSACCNALFIFAEKEFFANQIS